MALEFEVKVKDLFIFLKRLDYWFRQFPLEKWRIPQGYDYELAISPYAGTPVNWKEVEENGKHYIDVDFEIHDYDLSNRKDDLIGRIHRGLEVVSENITPIMNKKTGENLHLGVDPSLVIQGVNTINMLDTYRKFKYEFRVVNNSL